jgi:hypothetical protein
MPTDQRLTWLLGEVFNASAADYPAGDDRNDMVRNTFRIFQKMDRLTAPPTVGKKAIEERHKALGEVAAKLPERNLFDPEKHGILPIDQPDPTISNADWWRLLIVGFIAGLAVGMFAIWQLQEIRRRRQGR